MFKMELNIKDWVIFKFCIKYSSIGLGAKPWQLIVKELQALHQTLAITSVPLQSVI